MALPNGMHGTDLCRTLALVEQACREGASAEVVSEAGSVLEQNAYARGWLLRFDWVGWLGGDGRAVITDAERIREADLETTRKILTVRIRQSRASYGGLDVRKDSLVRVTRRLVECRREVDPVGAWLDEYDCFVPLHTGWEEIQGTVGLSSLAWARFKEHGFIGDMDCKWVIARVFRMYAMWRMSSPGEPWLVLSREGAQRVRAWLNPRQDEVDGPFLLSAFESAATYRPHGR